MLHADHVGSLLRPPELLEAWDANLAGRLPAAELARLEDEAIVRALAMQKAAGLGIFSDGEYRRTWFSGAMEAAVEGLADDSDPIIDHGAMWHGEHASEAVATGEKYRIGQQKAVTKLRAEERLTKHEADFLRAHAPGPFKITLTGPTQYSIMWFRPGVVDAYRTRLDMLADLTEITRAEVAALVAEGVDYVQLDSLRYARGIVDDADGSMYDAMIASDNAVLAPAREAGVTTGLHMCRGNNRSAWGDGLRYEESAERAFSELQVDRLLLEYDTERAGGFEPLRFVPKSTTVVLGLVSTKFPELESSEELKRRVEEASKFVDMDRLAISPQCGFASTIEGNLLSWDDQRRKLELVTSVANDIWG
jgi:5-methyltetrahydropteroyltriglutamate--homocysteine methyltransferase